MQTLDSKYSLPMVELPYMYIIHALCLSDSQIAILVRRNLSGNQSYIVIKSYSYIYTGNTSQATPVQIVHFCVVLCNFDA